MKRKPLLFLLLMAMFAPLAMNAQGLMKAPSGAALQPAPSQSRQITGEMTQTRDGWLQYDNGTHAGDYGLSTPYMWEYGPLYPASMLGNNNTLTKVSFWENSAMMADYGVTISVYAGGDDEPGDLIYSEDAELNGSSGMHEIELAQPVSIDPTQNLWITITVAGTYVFAVSPSSEANNDWVDWNGWSHGSAHGLSGLGWMIRGYVEYIDPNACPKPTHLTASNITTNSATLSWNGDASSYQVVYSDREGFNPDGATPIDVAANSYVLGHLADATTYYAYVRANCNGTYSAWSSMLAFTTVSVCAPPYNIAFSDITSNSAFVRWQGWQDSYTLRYAPAVFADDFENGLDDWTIYTEGESGSGVGWSTYECEYLGFPAISGSYVASSWSWSTNAYHANNWLVSPRVTLGGTLCFYVRTHPNYPDNYEVLLSTGGNATTDFTITLQALAPAPDNGEWNMVTIDLSSYSGQGYIAIHHVDYDMNYLLIDDFIVTGSFTTINDASSPYSLAGLTDNTEYLFQVQGICPNGTTDWSSVTFTTTTLCPPPTNLLVDDITANSAVVTWESDASFFEIDVNGDVTTDVSSPYLLEDLDSYTSYTVKVRSYCGETGYSNWIPISFMTECGAYLPYEYDFNDCAITSTPQLDCWFTYSFNEENDIDLIWIDQDEGDLALFFTSENEIDEETELYYQLLVSPELNAESAVNVQFYYISDLEEGEAFAVGCAYDDFSSLDDFDWYYFKTTEDDNWHLFDGIFPPGIKYVAVLYVSEHMSRLIVDDFSFDMGKTFTTDGDWDVAANWSPTGVPSNENVFVEANANIPGDFVAVVKEIIMGDEGSISIEDGGRLYQSTDGIEVTMNKNIPAYTGTTDNYQLLAFPFYDLSTPEAMTTAEGYDFYMFDNGQPGEEWQNSKQVEIEDLYMDAGYLYANPEPLELSMTGYIYPSNVYYDGYLNYEEIELIYDDTENEVNGWYLLGNPFIVDAYIYTLSFDEDDNMTALPMNAMYYDEDGDMQTIEGGPIAPMQGFFVSITEDVVVYIFPFDFLEWYNSKSPSMPSLKNLKKRSRKDNSIPAIKLSSINFDKSGKATPIKIMDVVTMPKKK